ncbi:hypothetical protein V5799_025866 [Amblyomma americanum]|uniref:CRAL-TRIO domain-containing protein n=1 Tax=Amblyomma americanum TaxID=6943 RepID=A0AAQ4E8D6_AMBAM
MSGIYTKKHVDDVFDTSRGALPLKLQKVAEEELGETPSKRQESLEKLRLLLQAEPDLNANDDDDFLLRFLRVRKYNVDLALQNIRKYYRNRADTPSIYREFLPSRVPPAARKLVMVMPAKDVHGRPIFLLKAGSWMPEEVPYLELHRAILICLEHMARDPTTQTLGVVIIVDYGGFSADRIFSASLGLMRSGIQYFQDCMPMRMKAAHVVRQSYAYDVLFALVKPFVKPKLVERKRLHGENFEKLHEEISPKALPEEYGGQGPAVDHEDCWRPVDADEETFAAENRFGYAINGQDDLPADIEEQREETLL